MSLYSVKVVGHAVELGIGILDEDLLDYPPDGGTEGDVVVRVRASRHSRVRNRDRVAVAIEDEGS